MSLIIKGIRTQIQPCQNREEAESLLHLFFSFDQQRIDPSREYDLRRKQVPCTSHQYHVEDRRPCCEGDHAERQRLDDQVEGHSCELFRCMCVLVTWPCREDGSFGRWKRYSSVPASYGKQSIVSGRKGSLVVGWFPGDDADIEIRRHLSTSNKLR